MVEVGVTIHEPFFVCHDWFFVCSSAVLNECLNGIGVHLAQFLHTGIARSTAARRRMTQHLWVRVFVIDMIWICFK